MTVQSLTLPTNSGPLNAVAITPSDTTRFAPGLRGVWVGVTGNVTVDMAGSGTNITFVGAPAGGFLAGYFTRVYATGTTATSLVGVW